MEIPKSKTGRNGNGEGSHHIIEMLYRAEGLVKNELRAQLDSSRSFEVRVLLEAQINIYRAIDALYDRESYRFIS